MRVSNRMEITAAVPGELDFPLGLASFRELMGKMRYPLLGGNVIDEATGAPLLRESLIVEAEGYRIGLLGVVSAAFEYRKKTLDHPGLKILDPADYLEDAVKRLKEDCDFIILLAHLNDEELGRVAKKAKGISFILQGHNTKKFSRDFREVSGYPVFQLPTRGREVGVLKIALRGRDFRFKNRASEAGIRKRIRYFEEVIAKADEEMEGRSPEEFYAGKPSRLRKYRDYKKKSAKDKKKLAKLSTSGSYYEFESIRLVKRVGEDMQVLGWMSKFAEAHDPETSAKTK